jgi:hypothetical protein
VSAKALSRRMALTAAVAMLAGCAAGQKRPPSLRPIRISALPVPSFQRGGRETRFGRLEYLSGLELLSEDTSFGGLSAIRLDTKGQRFLALSDQGHWVSGEIVYDGPRMVGIGNAEIAPLLDAEGTALASLELWDSESLAVDGNNAFVGIEDANAIMRYNLADGGLAARGTRIDLPEIKRLDSHNGLEAMTFMPPVSDYPGVLLAVAEDTPGREGGAIPGFLIDPRGGVETLSFVKSGRFRITDIAFLPDGDLVLLERAQSVWSGLDIRLRKIPYLSIRPGAELDGEILFVANPHDHVDNFEGLSAHQTAAGDMVLTLVSDNNYSVMQRSLLMQFKLRAA